MDTGSTVSERTEQQPGGERAFRWAAAFVVLLAVGLRVYDLDLKPFHHDEGVNGFFLTNLFRQGVYKYDPSNYHGPSLYYAAFVSAFLFGLNNIVVRLVTVFFGCLAVVLCLGTRRWLGHVAALAAALFVAVSPGMVFYSRYFIHEMLLVAATLGVVVAAQRFAETGWLGDLLAAATWAAWMFATKETALPTTIVLVVAVGCAWVYYHAQRHWRHAWRAGLASIFAVVAWIGWLAATKKPIGLTAVLLLAAAVGGMWTYYALRHWRDDLRPTLAFLGLTPRERSLFLICAAALFGVINLLLYSSFFTNPEGVLSALKTLGFWAQTGRTAHVHPWWQYLDWLWRAETPLVVMGALGFLLVLWRAENRFVVFVAAWTVGVLAMYSVTPYKTPWLTINIVLPLALLAGYAVEVLARRAWAWLGLGAVVVLALWVGTGGVEYMIRLWQSGKPLFIACALCLLLVLLFLALRTGHTLDFLSRRAWAWAGLVALVGLALWLGTGSYPWTQSTILLWQTEKPLVIAYALGLLLALWRPESRAVTFLAACSIGTLAIHGVVPAVTPWLAIRIALPLALLAGYTVEVLARRRLAWLGALVVLAASTMALRQSIDLNFAHYDDDSRPYVYAHTRRAFLDLIAAVDRVAKLSGQGENVRIAIPAREHWPLPWYLRRYHNTAYEDVAENSRASEMVIGGLDQDATLTASLGTSFDRLGSFALRPGVELVLFVRKGFASGPAAVTP